ncbi:ABC transporter substrate-binding protein [Limnochorda pilosa]|uniref:ABC transporter substrate-binding protein n=1 Tax=Limnochorda pilosa TaxID=1555112 RepID=A0A0K2SN41_LIMPI|nr:ABC transporter substrate-binding protein [Limnochorda pilosa]BAS28531.1 ABC transporter substrate-binding protein [Limnochorda pilosa]
MHRWIRAARALLPLVLAAVGFSPLGVHAAQEVRVGVIQIVEHPSLDQARQGFLDRMAELGYMVRADYQNAQGDMATAQIIARRLAGANPDLILAIATPTAQAAAQATSSIPILITAVTDAQAAGLVQSNERPGTNVTGTSDLNPVDQQLALIPRLDPSARRVGVLYNAGEANSLVQVEWARKAAGDLGLTLVEATVASSSEVLQAAQSLVGRVDALYVPTDNTVVSALESVIQVAEQSKLPMVVGEPDSVARGGLITVGIDYYELGRQTAEMADQVLKGADPAQMPIQYQANPRLVVNPAAAERMGVRLPEELLAQAEQVGS